ncbi:MAG: Asp-tRNA(Asn)/Glu-tRNA(Gln) amidotransferase subunit GatB [Nanoarchaeota archaeon]|nr:Asp-tRNA(Asn)/Glu-tRNA(Gln) amidotransferase subunit GatB [Nanoarchaeota archaeon]
MTVIIGLETHVQLPTKSKIFCGCKNIVTFEKEPEPNTVTCETCIGLPGAKPQVNSQVIEFGTRIALALECKINNTFSFSRKTYFYPDMGKNFQITQHTIPLGSHGKLLVDGKLIRITRVHVEEDPARLVHIGGVGGSHVLVDYNRSGTPLVEIVTEPDMTSPEQARAYLATLTQVLQYLGVYDPSTKAVLKSDANISLKGGARVEIKNITGEKEVFEALRFEMMRQKNLSKQGKRTIQETRLWNPELSVTQELRTKETEEDYGYIPEGDLTPITLEQRIILKEKQQLPELPAQKYKRYQRDYKVAPKLAEALLADPQLAVLFEAASKKIDSKLAATWIAGPLKKTLNWNNRRLEQTDITVASFVSVLKLFNSRKLTDRNAEMLIRYLVAEGGQPETLIKKHQLTGSGTDLDKVIKTVIKNNPKAARDVTNGVAKALNFLIGMVMKETKGTVDANTVRKALEKALR